MLFIKQITSFLRINISPMVVIAQNVNNQPHIPSIAAPVSLTASVKMFFG
jgi:hypothetical protein